MDAVAGFVDFVVDRARDGAGDVGVLIDKATGGPAFGGEYFDRAMFEELRGDLGTIRAKEAASVRAPGMTLRDWFAGQALAGMRPNHDGSYSLGDAERGRPKAEAKWCAAAAYRIADAMLAERARSVRLGEL